MSALGETIEVLLVDTASATIVARHADGTVSVKLVLDGKRYRVESTIVYSIIKEESCLEEEGR